MHRFAPIRGYMYVCITYIYTHTFAPHVRTRNSRSQIEATSFLRGIYVRTWIQHICIYIKNVFSTCPHEWRVRTWGANCFDSLGERKDLAPIWSREYIYIYIWWGILIYVYKSKKCLRTYIKMGCEREFCWGGVMLTTTCGANRECESCFPFARTTCPPSHPPTHPAMPLANQPTSI